jgi:hypothetical protein
MSARYWSKTCEAALAQEGTKHNETILLGTHGFTVACFIIGTAFTGYWVLRWTIIKLSDPEKLANAWRWLGPFLGLSFSCCIFGAAAWISKINLISSQIRLFVIASSGAIPPCRSSSALQKQANESQCIYRIAYALEFMCLFLSIVISLDRISEQAGSARALSGRILAPLTNSPPPQASRGARGQAKDNTRQDIQLMPITEDSSSPIERRQPSEHKNGNLRVLQFLIRAGIVVVALCSLVSLVAVTAAASFQAKIVSAYQRAYDTCSSEDTFTDEAIQILNDAVTDSKPLSRSICIGHSSEFSAGLLVLLLYATVGALGASIVTAARRKIQISLENLDRVHATIGDDAAVRYAGCCRVVMRIFTR